MGRRLTFLFALTAGVAVGNLYWAQPLLSLIADDVRTSTATAGWLVTTTHLGFAVAVLLIVPLGDVRDRRRLLPAVLLCCAAALSLCALAPTIGILLAILNQTGVLAVFDAARSRLNAAYVVASFTGGALGSALATTLWPTGGWSAITTAGLLLSVAALAVWAAGRPRRATAVPRH